MADEFQESDVMFDSNAAGSRIGREDSNNISLQFKSEKKKNNNNKKKSVPVNIPEKLYRNSRFQCYGEEGDQMVPPHVVVGRRLGGETACSVCSGSGRTLKGRDLSQVRNSILRMTGFLET